MKRYILLLLAVGCLFPVSAQQSTREILEEPLCLVAPESAQDTKQLVILQTSDTHSRIEPIAAHAADRYAGMGGTVRRSTFVKEARKVNPDLLLFDCGDISQGTPYYNLFQGEVEIKMMNLMGYDAMTIGNHEFDFGLENMARLFRMANFFLIVCFRQFPAGNYPWSSLSAVCTFSINFFVQLFFSKKSTTFSVSSSRSSPSSMYSSRALAVIRGVCPLFAAIRMSHRLVGSPSPIRLATLYRKPTSSSLTIRDLLISRRKPIPNLNGYIFPLISNSNIT